LPAQLSCAIQPPPSLLIALAPDCLGPRLDLLRHCARHPPSVDFACHSTSDRPTHLLVVHRARHGRADGVADALRAVAVVLAATVGAGAAAEVHHGGVVLADDLLVAGGLLEVRRDDEACSAKARASAVAVGKARDAHAPSGMGRVPFIGLMQYATASASASTRFCVVGSGGMRRQKLRHTRSQHTLRLHARCSPRTRLPS
jgi:hypothetical protein